MATILPSLTPVQMLAVYPEGLMCMACGRLLATRRASYTRALFMVDEHPRCRAAFIGTYVCAECRWDQQEAARAAASRALAARGNLAHARAARAARGRIQPPVVSVVNRHSDARHDAGLHDRVSIPRAPGLQGAARARRLRHRGGRPRKHASTVISLREARRAYRARQRGLTPAPAIC